MRRPSWREVDDLGFWGCARRLRGLPSIKPLVCAFRIRVAPALVELGRSALIMGEEGRPFCGVRPGALGRDRPDQRRGGAVWSGHVPWPVTRPDLFDGCYRSGHHTGHARRHHDPEAFEHTHDWAGLITVVGFLAAYLLSRLGG